MKQIILDYDSFEVYLENGDYWFRDKDEEGQPIKVKVVASFEYDYTLTIDDESLQFLVSCDYMCQGEQLFIEDGGIVRHLWFDIVEEGE